MKNCLISLVIWYMPIEITIKYQHPPTEWSKLKEMRPNVRDNAENLERPQILVGVESVQVL